MDVLGEQWLSSQCKNHYYNHGGSLPVQSVCNLLPQIFGILAFHRQHTNITAVAIAMVIDATNNPKPDQTLHVLAQNCVKMAAYFVKYVSILLK